MFRAQASDANEGLNSGQNPVLPQKLSEDRARVCFFWFCGFVFFFPKAVRSAGSVRAPWKGDGPSLQRLALRGRRMPGGAGLASEVAAPLQSRLVCIIGEVFSKLLLLSAPFPSKNGQRPPSSQWTDFLEQSTDLEGVFVALLTHAWLLSGRSASFT